MKRLLTLIITLLTVLLPVYGQMLAVDKTNRLRGDKLIICGSGNKLDSNAVNDLLRQGLRIVSAGYTQEGWTIAMARGTGYKSQEYLTSSVYPKTWIEERLLHKNMRITSLAWGNGTWCVVMSSDSPYGLQHIIGAPNWTTTDERIEYFMKKGEYITASTYGDGKWTVVMSPCSIYTKQVYFKNRDLSELNSEIKRYWNLGYTITNLGVGAGEVLCVMSAISSGSPYASEDRALIRATNFRRELRDFWDQGYHVVNVCNGVIPR